MCNNNHVQNITLYIIMCNQSHCIYFVDSVYILFKLYIQYIIFI